MGLFSTGDFILDLLSPFLVFIFVYLSQELHVSQALLRLGPSE